MNADRFDFDGIDASVIEATYEFSITFQDDDGLTVTDTVKRTLEVPSDMYTYGAEGSEIVELFCETPFFKNNYQMEDKVELVREVTFWSK